MRILGCVLISLFLAATVSRQQAPQSSGTANELTAMLNQFIRDASSNRAAGFERFFADDVIYTGSNGMVLRSVIQTSFARRFARATSRAWVALSPPQRSITSMTPR